MEKCGLCNNAFTKWKDGSSPSVDTVYTIAKFLNVSMEYLLTGEEPAIKPDIIELAESIQKLPIEYQEIIKNNIKQFQDICFKLEKENIQNIS